MTRTEISWFEEKALLPLLRKENASYVAPFAPMSVAVTGANDRQMINACLLYRFSMSYEPRDFHGELDEIPVSMAYGRAVDELRRRHRAWLWDAEFRDTIGAEVRANGEPLKTFTVFQRKDGLRAVAFANMRDDAPAVCEVSLLNPATKGLHWISPESPEPKPWPGKLELVPGSVAVLLEG